MIGAIYAFSFLDVAITATSFIMIAYIWVTWNNDYFSKRNIPHEKPLPILGNTASNVFRKQSIADRLFQYYMSFEGHKFCGIFQFMTPAIILRDPELIKRVAVKDFEHFTDHVNFLSGNNDPIFTSNLFVRKGQKWRNMRHTLSPAFTSSKMKSMFVLISQCGEHLVNYLTEQIQHSDNGIVELEMKDFFTRHTNDVIATCAFGVECNSLKDRNNRFYLTGKEVTNFEGARQFTLFFFMLFPKLMTLLKIPIFPKDCIRFFTTLVKDTLSTREKKGIVRPDMIHLLMQARKGELKNEDGSDGATASSKINSEELTDSDIAAQAMVFFLVGFDTASALLCFASLLLSIHPEMQEQLQKEIDKTLKANNGRITYESLHAMKYLDMVVSESLRLYPPVPGTDRVCTKHYTIPASHDNPAVSFKPNDRVSIPIFALHRDPKYYPDPEKFDPERFSDENKHRITPFTYMPFGVGPRICIGNTYHGETGPAVWYEAPRLPLGTGDSYTACPGGNESTPARNRLALMENKIALVYLLSEFDLVVTRKTQVPIKLSKKGFNMAVENGFWAGLKLRGNKN